MSLLSPNKNWSARSFRESRSVFFATPEKAGCELGPVNGQTLVNAFYFIKDRNQRDLQAALTQTGRILHEARIYPTKRLGADWREKKIAWAELNPREQTLVQQYLRERQKVTKTCQTKRTQFLNAIERLESTPPKKEQSEPVLGTCAVRWRNLPFRSGPNFRNKVQGSFPQGVTLAVLETQSNGFWRVRKEGPKEAAVWIWSRGLTKSARAKYSTKSGNSVTGLKTASENQAVSESLNSSVVTVRRPIAFHLIEKGKFKRAGQFAPGDQLRVTAVFRHKWYRVATPRGAVWIAGLNNGITPLKTAVKERLQAEFFSAKTSEIQTAFEQGSQAFQAGLQAKSLTIGFEFDYGLYRNALAWVEANTPFDYQQKSPSSSAAGRYQILKVNRSAKILGRPVSQSEFLATPALQEKALAKLTLQNIQSLKAQFGIKPNYHFAGKKFTLAEVLAILHFCGFRRGFRALRSGRLERSPTPGQENLKISTFLAKYQTAAQKISDVVHLAAKQPKGPAKKLI